MSKWGGAIMKLNSINYICKENLINLKVERIEHIQNNTQYFKINNWIYLREKLECLKKVDVLKSNVESIYSISDFLATSNNIVLDLKQVRALEALLSKIRLQAETIVGLCDSLGYTYNDKIEFDIKLPEEADLLNFSKNIEDLSKVLMLCPFFQMNDAYIKIQKVDVGSTWLEMIIIGGAALKLLEKLTVIIERTLAVWSQIKMIKLQEEQYRKAEIDTDHLEVIVEANEKVIKSLAKNLVAELDNEKNLDPEETDKAKMCFEMLIDLYDKGLEFHNSVKDQEEPKILFPTSKDWKQISKSTINLLTEKDD